jgi:hypothetical protein
MPVLSPLDWIAVKASGVIAVVYVVWALVQPAPPPLPPKPARPGAPAPASVAPPGPQRDETCYSIGSHVARGCRPY